MFIFDFLFGFLISFQDLPRLSIRGQEIRLAFILAPFFLFFLIKNIKDVKKTLNNGDNKKILFPLLALHIYFIFQLIFICHNGRAIGFFFWFVINSTVFLYALTQKTMNVKNWMIRGFIAALCVSVIHIIVQRFSPYFLVNTDRLLECIDNQNHYRLFSWFGEPSYACLYLLILASWSSLHKSRKINLLVFPTLIAMTFTYSKLAILGVSVFYLFCILRNKKEKNAKKLFLEISFACVAFVSSYQWFPQYYSRESVPIEARIDSKREKILQDIEVKTHPDDIPRVGMRQASLMRGWEAFQQNPLFGVGLGNSKKYIKDNQLKPLLFVTYEGLSNLYLEVLVELGAVGLLLFLFFIFRIYQIKKITADSTPFWLTILITMQFCQNINMPAIWMSLLLF